MANFCSQCGARPSPGARFCPTCGRGLAPGGPLPAVPPPPPPVPPPPAPRGALTPGQIVLGFAIPVAIVGIAVGIYYYLEWEATPSTPTPPPTTTGSYRSDPPEKRTTPDKPARVVPRPLDGFPAEDLPPIAEEASALVDARGGTVALSDGTRLTLPPGEFSKPATVTLRRLRSDLPDCEIYHIASPVETLRSPAELEFPVEAPAGEEAAAIVVEHFRDGGDEGRMLDVEWRPGDRTARVRMKELCLLTKTLLVGAVGKAIELQLVNNKHNIRNEARKAAAEQPKTSCLLQVPRYFQGEALWCAPTSFAMIAQAASSQFQEPWVSLKPQTLAAAAAVRQQTTIPLLVVGGLAGWRYFAGTRAEPFRTMKKATGADIRIRRWLRYDRMIRDILSELVKGHPVSLDVPARAHVVTVVGFDQEGLLIQDPAFIPPCVTRWAWDVLADYICSPAIKALWACWTVSIQADIQFRGTLNLNTHSCSVPRGSVDASNQQGFYFEAPNIRASGFRYTGFLWDERAPETGGVRPATGPKSDILLDAIGVGSETEVGYYNLLFFNNSTSSVRRGMRLLLVDPADRAEINLMGGTITSDFAGLTEADDLDANAGGRYRDVVRGTLTLAHSPKEVRLLPLLDPAKRGRRRYIVRFSLLFQDIEIDRLDLPVVLHPLRIDDVDVETSGGVSTYRLTGSGFTYRGLPEAGATKKPVDVELGLRADRHVRLTSMELEGKSDLKIESDTAASFTVPERMAPREITLEADDGLRSNTHSFAVVDLPPVKPPCSLKLSIRTKTSKSATGAKMRQKISFGLKLEGGPTSGEISDAGGWLAWNNNGNVPLTASGSYDLVANTVSFKIKAANPKDASNYYPPAAIDVSFSGKFEKEGEKWVLKGEVSGKQEEEGKEVWSGTEAQTIWTGP